MKKTVFISSTFEDLKEHRKNVWATLEKYEVIVRGMEKFGARKENPLQTCLSEVEQSDIFICIISSKIGTIEPSTSKSYTQLEYEKAYELKKDILIYIIDQSNGKVSLKNVDFGESHDKLESFKSILNERHTRDTFTDANDLAEKLDRKFQELLSKKYNVPEPEDEYHRTLTILNRFLLLPKEFSNKEVKIKIKIIGDPFPASKSICKSFFLSYGKTLGIRIQLIRPNINENAFNYIFIESDNANQFLNIDRNKEIEIYATPIFTEDTIDIIRANFVSKTSSSYVLQPSVTPISTYAYSHNFLNKETETTQSEGQIILLLKRFINKENPIEKRSNNLKEKTKRVKKK